MNLEIKCLFRRIRKNYKKARKMYDEVSSSNIQKSDEIDGLYRVYHQSWKMYDKMKAAITNYANIFLQLIGCKIGRNEDELIEKMKELDLNHYFFSTIEEALRLHFLGNNKRTWYKHQKVLTSALYHLKISIDSIMKVAEKYIEEGKLPGEKNVLNTEDAIFIEVLNIDYCDIISTKKIKNGKNAKTFKGVSF